MKRNSGLWLALAMVSCQPATPADTVESLAADPERLEEVQRQCKQDYARIGAVVCDAASKAYRRRFMGHGKADNLPEE